MGGYEKLGLGHAIHALNIKMVDMQRELAVLRQDVKRVLFLLESQHSGAQTSDQPDSEIAKPKSKIEA